MFDIHVKRHEDEIDRDLCERYFVSTRGSSIDLCSSTFGMTRVPVESVCLLSHTVAIAIYTDAFATKFTYCEEVLRPKTLLKDHMAYMSSSGKTTSRIDLERIRVA